MFRAYLGTVPRSDGIDRIRSLQGYIETCPIEYLAVSYGCSPTEWRASLLVDLEELICFLSGKEHLTGKRCGDDHPNLNSDNAPPKWKNVNYFRGDINLYLDDGAACFRSGQRIVSAGQRLVAITPLFDLLAGLRKPPGTPVDARHPFLYRPWISLERKTEDATIHPWAASVGATVGQSLGAGAFSIQVAAPILSDALMLHALVLDYQEKWDAYESDYARIHPTRSIQWEEEDADADDEGPEGDCDSALRVGVSSREDGWRPERGELLDSSSCSQACPPDCPMCGEED